MIIDNKLIEIIEHNALESPRLRSNFCIHQSTEDKVQKMVNVLLPGTEIPIHCHNNSDETLSLLKGAVKVLFYNEFGNEVDEVITMSFETGNLVVDIPKGVWHTVVVEEPVALLEIKEGPYRPLERGEIIV